MRGVALVVQEVTHRFPGRGAFGLGHHARGDLDRAPGGDRQRPMRLLHRKKSHSIAKKINVMTIDAGLGKHGTFIVRADLLGTLARPEVDDVVTDGDSARIRIGSYVLHLVDHGGLARALVARCREVSAWLK